MSVDKIVISATRVSMFLQCKWKYWCNYILHLPKKSNISFKLGLAVHESLKVAGLIWQKKENFTSYDIRKIKEVYRKTAAQEGIEDMGVYNDGMLLLTSKLQDFEVGKIINVEDKFKVTTDDGVMITGALDKVIELAEDTLLVVDYKTSKFYYTPDEMKNDIQLSMYDVAVSIKFPNYKRIILCLDYLRGEPLYTYRTYKERKNFIKYILAVYHEMLNLEERKAKPTINDFCNWCDFKEECPAYKEAGDIHSKINRKNPEKCTDKELVKEYTDIKNRKRILDDYEKKLKLYIMGKIDRDQKNLEGSEKEVYIRQNPRTNYDPKVVYDTIPLNEFLQMVSVYKKKLDEYMDGMSSGDKAKIVESANKEYTNSFLAIKNINK